MKWGDVANINCPYTPGALISDNNGYTLNWRFNRTGSGTLLPLLESNFIGDLFEHEKGTDVNIFRIFQFNPLFEGVYICTLRIDTMPIKTSYLSVTISEFPSPPPFLVAKLDPPLSLPLSRP